MPRQGGRGCSEAGRWLEVKAISLKLSEAFPTPRPGTTARAFPIQTSWFVHSAHSHCFWSGVGHFSYALAFSMTSDLTRVATGTYVLTRQLERNKAADLLEAVGHCPPLQTWHQLCSISGRMQQKSVTTPASHLLRVRLGKFWFYSQQSWHFRRWHCKLKNHKTFLCKGNSKNK